MSQTQGGKPIEIPGFGSLAPESREARWLGPLLGMAVGDALGTTYEFKRIDQPSLPTLATGPATDVVGGGPFNLRPGQITDDTQMAICIARSFVERGELDAADLARRYLAWREHAFDVGNQTSSALSAIANGTAPLQAGREVWHHGDRRPAGNGSLMRTAPLAVLLSGKTQRLLATTIDESLITHADPRCVLACVGFNFAIAQALISQRGEPLVEIARVGIKVAAGSLRERWSDDKEDVARVDSAESDINRDLDMALADDPQLYGDDVHLQRMAGFVRVAFRLAFWHLVHTPSWRDAVVDTASRGADADTNAAIVGALLGARDGVGAIPTAWVERVLGATQRGPAEWADAHHPRHLLAIVSMLRE